MLRPRGPAGPLRAKTSFGCVETTEIHGAAFTLLAYSSRFCNLPTGQPRISDRCLDWAR